MGFAGQIQSKAQQGEGGSELGPEKERGSCRYVGAPWGPWELPQTAIYLVFSLF